MKPRDVELVRGERVIAAILFALGAYMVWTSTRMPAGTFSTPGPGFFPRIIGVLLLAAAAGTFFRAHLNGTRSVAVTQLGHRDVLVVFGILLVGSLAFKWLGAPLTVALMGAAILRTLRPTPAWKVAIFGVTIGVVSWLVFVRLLEVQLPAFSLF